MKTKFNRLNRNTHHWGAIIISLPLLIVIVTGILLLLKKEISWIQPSAIKGQGEFPVVSYEKILETSRSVEEAGIKSWADIKKMDYRPSKGLIKVISRTNWEVQIDQSNGQLLSKAFRRSDIIESIHDGSFFHNNAKLAIFLPSALVLLILWITGIYMFFVREKAKRVKKKKALSSSSANYE